MGDVSGEEVLLGVVETCRGVVVLFVVVGVVVVDVEGVVEVVVVEGVVVVVEGVAGVEVGLAPAP